MVGGDEHERVGQHAGGVETVEHPCEPVIEHEHRARVHVAHPSKRALFDRVLAKGRERESLKRLVALRVVGSVHSAR